MVVHVFHIPMVVVGAHMKVAAVVHMQSAQFDAQDRVAALAHRWVQNLVDVAHTGAFAAM